MEIESTRRATPRPHFEGPRVLRREDAAHHVWGDASAGLVTDRVISSSDQLHVLEFELPPGAAFRHSEDNPTLFAADVAYLCLAGTLVLTDPETGEVALAPAGSGVYFGRDTWHHGYSLGSTTTTVLEFMSPPPSRGTASTYGRTRPPLAEVRRSDARWRRRWPAALAEQRASRRLLPLRLDDALLSFRDSGPDHLLRTLLDTPFLTVVHGTAQPGVVDEFALVPDERVLRVLEGELWVDVRILDAGASEARPTYWAGCLQAGDSCFLPAASEARMLVRADRPATYLQGEGRVPESWRP
jgi:hypothetical protein